MASIDQNMDAAQQSRWRKLWWLPVAAIAVAVAIAAFVLRYRPPDYPKVIAPFVESVRALEADTPPMTDVKPVRYVRKRTAQGPNGSYIALGTSTVTPLGGGWLLRVDDWHDQYGQALLYQERHVMYRGLYSVASQYREVGPIFHELFGSLGWRNDETQAQTVTGALPTGGKDVTLLLVQTNRSDFDWNTVHWRPMTEYRRTTSCRPVGLVAGRELHDAIKGQHQLVACSVSVPEYMNGHAFVAELGQFLPVERQAATGSAPAPLALQKYELFEVLRE